MASTSVVKTCVFIFDTICSLIALVLISFGIYLICSYSLNQVGSSAAYAYIGLGVATLLIFLLGCLGALRDNVCCTVTFIILLVVVIIAQVVIVFILTSGRNSIASNLANTLDDTWEDELNRPGAMSIYENWFGCCGRGSPQDYIVNERLPPASCFKNHDNSKSENLIEKGCRMEFENYWINLLNIFNILAWIMIAVECVGSILACCLCNSIRNDRRRLYI